VRQPSTTVQRAVDRLGDLPSFRQIALLDAVDRLGAIQRAAAECGMTQPGVTQALALLQRRAGVDLISRRATGSALTASGRLFLARIAPALDTVTRELGLRVAENPQAALRQITPVHVRLIRTIIETGSLDIAARAIGLTMNAARRTAHAIEAQIGPLFERTPGGVRLFPSAHACAEALVGLERDISVAVREARSAQADEANTLVVGAAQAFGNRLLAQVLSELAGHHPEARITVLRESPAELVTRLRAGEVHLVVGDVDDVGADLVKSRLVATPYFVFGRPGHPLTRLKDIAVDDLSRFAWVGGTPGSVREKVRGTLFAGHSAPHVAFAASEGAVVGHFVAGSDRLALMTEHESRCGGFALGKLPFPPIEAGLGIDVVCRADRQLSALHEELVQLLRQHLAGGQARPARDRRAA
jgi:LysR family transcriptional regulator of gallate degradation